VSSERRGARRVAADLPAVRVLAGTTPRRIECRTIDLSRGGCRVASVAEVPDGARGLVAVVRGELVCTRPVQEVLAIDEGEVRLLFAATAGGPDEWDQLLEELGAP
jgi:hypothetical protein